MLKTRLRPYQTSDLVFSCIRSKIAYMELREIICSFENKNNMMSCDGQNKCNTFIRKSVQKRIDKINNKPIFYDGFSKNKRDAQGYIVWDDDRIYITYRGTCSPRDVIDNLDMRRKKLYKNITVHQGYYEQFMSIEEDITRDIKHISKHYPIKELVFGGHSLASAVSTISSPYYGQLFKSKFKITSHTCGGGAVGNIDFVNWFCTNVDENFRIETKEDVVPYISFYRDFYHVPNGLKISKDGRIETQYEIKPYSYLKILKLICCERGWDQIYKDHSCDNYIDSLFAMHEE